MEALVRWSDAELGAVPSCQFIKVAEECGLITRLGEWVLRQVCHDAKRLRGVVDTGFFTCVNVSGAQINRGGFPQALKNALAESGLEPDDLRVEITESEVVAFSREVSKDLKELSALGVRAFLDDFGTGHSSLAQLRDLPIHGIKIDRSFVAAIKDTREDHPIVSAIVRLGEALGLAVIAEGVETEEQRDFLAESGCSVMQGWLFGHPKGWEAIAADVEAGSYVLIPLEDSAAG
jgi:EAL domain-containing protein (putative c-di-GMP-specific phosphodiesterase class I)